MTNSNDYEVRNICIFKKKQESELGTDLDLSEIKGFIFIHV